MSSDRNDKIVAWVAEKVQREFQNDISLVLIYGSYINGTANSMSDVDFYFIPKTKKGYELSQTFIVEGIGYDLFPMSWERVEGLAELSESLTPCLANVKILYSACVEENRRFERIQHKLQSNLSDSAYMHKKDCERFGVANGLFNKMPEENDICSLRLLAGNIALSLAEAVAYMNHTYYKRGLKTQLQDLAEMARKPKDIVALYTRIVKAVSGDEIKSSCREMLVSTGAFLKCDFVIPSKTADQGFSERSEPNRKIDYCALAELYQEIVSTFNKIYLCCGSGNVFLAFISAVCLQRELDEACSRNGLKRYNLLGMYAPDNLENLSSKTKEAEIDFVKIIKSGGATIKSYRTIEDFFAAAL